MRSVQIVHIQILFALCESVKPLSQDENIMNNKPIPLPTSVVRAIMFPKTVIIANDNNIATDVFL